MPYYDNGQVRIRYEEAGSGFPLLVMPGGGLNSRISNWSTAVYNFFDTFKNEYRVITMDQRNSNEGESTGPLDAADPWGAFAADQLGLMDYPDVMYRSGRDVWGPQLMTHWPDITAAQVEAYLRALYRTNPDFVYSVTREFVRGCQTPMLVMPDDVPAHPYQVCEDILALAPNAEVTIYPWKDTPELKAKAVEHVRAFLEVHKSVGAGLRRM